MLVVYPCFESFHPRAGRVFFSPPQRASASKSLPGSGAITSFFSGVCVKPSAFSQRVAGFVTFTPCTELFRTIINNDRRAHCYQRASGPRGNVRIVGVYGSVHHSAGHNSRSGSASSVFS